MTIVLAFLRRSCASESRFETAPTEYDAVFRKRRVWGEVHDENAFLLDGVAAHAGIFSTAEDMCKLAVAYGRCLKEDGLLRRKTAQQMIAPQAEDGGERRGLIWQLRSGEGYTSVLSSAAYGHAGFTGCFLWNDPERELSAVVLSNDVYNGRENRKLFQYREEMMRLIVQDVH